MTSGRTSYDPSNLSSLTCSLNQTYTNTDTHSFVSLLPTTHLVVHVLEANSYALGGRVARLKVYLGVGDLGSLRAL